MSEIFVGIDIAKDKFDAALIVEEQSISKSFQNSSAGFKPFLCFISKHSLPDVHVCMEATGHYGCKLATFLFEQGIKVSVVNPMQIKGFGKSELVRTKNDKADAKLIARFCRAIQPKLWEPIPEHIAILRSYVQRLDSLNSMKRQEENRLESSPVVIQDMIEKTITFIKKQIDEVKKEINDHMDNDGNLSKQNKLLRTIPGLGSTSTPQLLAFIGDINNFKSARGLAAFAGLSPKQHQSGSSVRGRTTISKIGNTKLRKTLYFPAIVAKKHNPTVRSFCHNLEQSNKVPMVIVCAAMRKLLHIIYGVLKHEEAFNPNVA